mmetsp:Transcript_529/g.709  ORF Transcript_529/g.709 Transcript_529/m.709 type:complete len:262 (-) Transcript_529:376-1161(-)
MQRIKCNPFNITGRLNMEKECAFFSNLFGGDARLCADSTMTLFSGIWFDTDKPTPEQKNWVGRMVTNFQHSEAILHFTIVIFGLIMVFYLAFQNKNVKAPALIRWIFFAALFFETYTMCWPYLFLFGWAWDGVTPNPRNTIVDTLVSLGSEDPYMDGIQMGASLITMFWVSVIVLILDGWAMYRAGEYAMGRSMSSLMLQWLIYGVTTSYFFYYANEFFKPGARGSEGTATLATQTLDWLHGLYGNEGHISMLDVANLHKK